MSLWRKGGRGNALELVSLLTFFLADIVKLGEKLEIGKCLPRARRGSCKDVYVYVDVAGFKGLIKERKSYGDDDPCNCKRFLFCILYSRRVLFTYLHQYKSANSIPFVSSDFKSLSISKKKKENLSWKSSRSGLESEKSSGVIDATLPIVSREKCISAREFRE